MARPCAAAFPLAVLLVAAACGDLTAPEIVGIWGGEHVVLTVTLAGSTLEYDCAHGTVDGVIVPDPSGDFTVSGVHVFEHGGPIAEDEVPDAHPARYEGWTDGSRMMLRVTLTDTNQVVGLFELRLGRPGMVVKCL